MISYIGIDPGKKGAIAIIEDGDVTIYDMPLTPEGKVDCHEIRRILFSTRYEVKTCFLEKFQFNPKNGKMGIATFGMGYGVLTTVLELEEIPYQEIHSMTWKKEFTLIKKTKKDAAAAAMKLFPQIKDLLYGPKGGLKDGRAEAVLMAEFWRRNG